MKKAVLLGLVVIASAIVGVSFFLPWAKVTTSVTGVSKGLTDIAKDELDKFKDVPIADKVVGSLERVTGALSDIGDIKLKTTVSGYNIPVFVNNRTSKVALSITQIMFKSAEGLDLKSYLVYLLPVLGIVCTLLAVLGLKNKVCIVIMSLVSGAISIAGLYNLKTMDIATTAVKISIEKGLWYTMYAFLAIFFVGIVWLILDKKA